MKDIPIEIKDKKTVQVLCSYCNGYEKKILSDDDLAEVDGFTTDFEITCPITKKHRKVCDKCIRMINLEDKVIMLLDHLLDSNLAKAQRATDKFITKP
jgi:hypothetical protein